jgi:hypothetical protein
MFDLASLALSLYLGKVRIGYCMSGNILKS